MKRYIRSATIQYDTESGMYRDNVDHYGTLEDFFFLIHLSENLDHVME